MGSDKRQPYRDSSGRTLADYPRPSVAVDTALLTVRPGEGHLSVLQVRHASAGGWALPGTFLHPGERLIDAVQRSLLAKAGVRGTRPRQLQVFDDPRRDDRGWVLSVAHVDVVRVDRLAHSLAEQARLVPVNRPGRLRYDHVKIIDRAVADVRARYARSPDPDRLLPEPFTILELRLLHEAVAGRARQRDTFRRLMEPQLSGTGTTTSGTRGRPAELFCRRAVRRHAGEGPGGRADLAPPPTRPVGQYARSSATTAAAARPASPPVP